MAVEMDNADVLLKTGFKNGKIEGIKLYPFTTPNICYYEEAVTLTEKYKRQAYINSAKQIIYRLKDSKEKTVFLERLDAIGK